MSIEVQGPLGCHIWQGATNERGYPVMRSGGRVQPARRVVYERDKRKLLPGEIVVMECDERLCISSSHMRAKPRVKPG